MPIITHSYSNASCRDALYVCMLFRELWIGFCILRMYKGCTPCNSWNVEEAAFSVGIAMSDDKEQRHSRIWWGRRWNVSGEGLMSPGNINIALVSPFIDRPRHLLRPFASSFSHPTCRAIQPALVDTLYHPCHLF